MIIRVLHEGQYELESEPLQQVTELDDQLFQAVADGDAERYGQLLEEVLRIIREQGRPLEMTDLRPSELVLPAPDSTIEEVQSLFVQEGLLGSP